MSTFQRIGREYTAQIFAFVVALADRLFIPAVLIRYLGVAEFSAWSLAIATGAFVAVLEFGLTRYYTNRLIYLVERGETGEAQRVYRVATTLLVTSVAGALAIIALAFPYLVSGVGEPQVDRILSAAVVPITLAAAVLQLLALRHALYRAHRHYTAETIVRLIGDALRIAVVVLAAWLGAGLLAAAWLWFAATIAFVVLPISIDTLRRYPRFIEAPQLPRPEERADVAKVSPGLWLQSMFTTLYASVPVLVVGAVTASPAVITQFVLMRMIANFVRQVQQMFANLFAIELARRAAIGDQQGHAQIFGEVNRLLGIQAAVASAALIVLGQELFALWTGRTQLFDLTLLVLAVGPPLLVPASILSIEALSYANRPWPIVRARLIQFALTVTVFFVAPIDHVAVRMMAALAIGEVAGLGLPLIVSVHGLNPVIAKRSVAALTVVVMPMAAVSYLVISAVASAPVLPADMRFPAALAAAAVVALVASLALGVSAARRKQIFALAGGLLHRAR